MKPSEHPPSVFADLLATRETPTRVPTRLRRTRTRSGPVTPYEQRSLFGEILDLMFAPLLLLWPLSVAVTFLVARSLADVPFDRSLVDRTTMLAEHVRIVASEPRAVPLGETAGHLLRTDDGSKVYFQVLGVDGERLAGEADLPRPGLYDFPEVGRVKLRNAALRRDELRVAYTHVPMPGTAAEGSGRWMLVQVGETLQRRAALANEIIKGVIFPQFLILPLALALLWFGLSRGLAPLKMMQQGIRERRQDDLSPIDPRGVPEEVAPLIDAFNELLLRQARSLDAQKRFIADAAHQMKTPLAGLRTQAELAMRNTDPKQLQRSLAHLVRSSARTAHLVSQLLALARTENLRDAIALQPMELCPLVCTVASEAADRALSQRIDFGVEHSEESTRIVGHPILLRELINNLIDNALHYTPEQGVVTVRTRATPDEVVLEVEDDGSGIPESEREMVFERFYRVLGVQGDGSGLGLPIVREIAVQHAAQVEIHDGIRWPAERGQGAGTRVSVRFPRLPDPDQ